MTYLEICKRIAEIEGKKGHEFMGVFVLSENYNEAVNESHSNSYSFSPCHYEYNPLTDDALCFQLMDKYSVSINTHFQNPDTKQAYVTYLKGFRVVTTDVFSINDLGINKAICLAIIEAHK